MRGRRANLRALEDEEVGVVVAVEELKVKLDRLFAAEDGDDPRPGGVDVRLALVNALEGRTDDFEELLSGGLSKVEGDLVGGEDVVVGDGGRGGGGGKGEERGKEVGREGGVVEVDEALADGKVVGGREGREKLDELLEDLFKKQG